MEEAVFNIVISTRSPACPFVPLMTRNASLYHNVAGRGEFSQQTDACLYKNTAVRSRLAGRNTTPPDSSECFTAITVSPPAARQTRPPLLEAELGLDVCTTVQLQCDVIVSLGATSDGQSPGDVGKNCWMVTQHNRVNRQRPSAGQHE